MRMRRYFTICTCPVCAKVFEQIWHDEPQPHGQSVAMMCGGIRREHANRSPECTKHDDWMKGWNTKTYELALYEEPKPKAHPQLGEKFGNVTMGDNVIGTAYVNPAAKENLDKFFEEHGR
jgi:hypothetical protein